MNRTLKTRFIKHSTNDTFNESKKEKIGFMSNKNNDGC